MPLQHARRPALAVLLLLASGCAPLEWRHTGSGEHNVDNDQAQCMEARFEARQRLPLQPVPVPQVIVDQQGRTIVVQNNKPPDSERFFLEQSLMRQCMSERGYILEPKQPE